jgi:hypothetical protein
MLRAVTGRIEVAGMTRSSGSKPAAPPAWPGRKEPARALQRAAAEAVFAPHARVLRAPPPPRAAAEELVAQPGGGFQVRAAERHTFSPPTGTFNFVRIQGEAPRSRPILVSAKLAHAQMSGGRPVVYAGTARFERGEMAWWSNYSGTYQPIAAFRAQAGLPEDKFVPWQKLQMGGTAMQRGVFSERRAAGPPARPGATGDAADKSATGRPGSAGTQPKAEAGRDRSGGMPGGLGRGAGPGFKARGSGAPG